DTAGSCGCARREPDDQQGPDWNLLMSASSATLEIRGVSRRFGKNTAVSDVNISIPQGQMVGVIGRSGAGKSTLLRMINRLVDPSEGTIPFRGGGGSPPLG